MRSMASVFFMGALYCMGSLVTRADAQLPVDFRMETDVLEPGKSKPIDQSVVLFAAGVSYEFSRQSPNRITIIDYAGNRIVQLDTDRQLQTRLNLQDLLSEMERAKQDYAQTTDGAQKIHDGSQVSTQASTNQISVGQRFIRYDAKTSQPPDPKIAEQYAAFANASALLGAKQARGVVPPPFARLTLNDALRQRSELPLEITRTVSLGDRNAVLLSRLHPTYSLNESDRKLVAGFNSMLVSFKSLELAEFHSPTPR